VLTGVIYGAIVVVWAAYLVPLALRRHDEASRSRSIAKFSSAMRVLARRGEGGTTAVARSARVVLTPKAKDSGPILPSPAPESPQVLVTPPPNRAAERAAAARRRQVLSVLVGLTTVVVLVSLVGVTPWWSVLVPLTMILAFLAIARRSVRRANEAYWTAAAAAPEQSTSVVVRRSAARVDAGRRPCDDEPTVTLTAAEREQAAAAMVVEEHVVAVSLETPEGGSLWDPLPVTLPSYVTAAVAKRTFRTIDLGEPGTWSSGHSEADSETAAASATQSPASASASMAAPVEDDEPDEVAKVVNA
jgi:hypothetical protein